MESRVKEDEKNEKSIRALLKLSENRKCINCGSLGPQYVCTTFSIFVCTNCSGLHRGFTHRIKSVSMAKFTAEEVKSLQAGGNERGREIFFKDFDFSRNSLPDSSNPDRLRDFIKAVYVERRYGGERAMPPKSRPGDRQDSYGRTDLRASPRDFRAGHDSRSPSYEDRCDDRRFPERRRSDADRGRYDDRRCEDRVVRFEEKGSPSRVDLDPRARYSRGQYEDRQHDDRSPYEERERDRRSSYEDRLANESRHDKRRSAEDRNFKDFVGDSPVRPVSEILGENTPTLRVEEFRHTNGLDTGEARDSDNRSSLGSPATMQSNSRRDERIPRLGSFGSANGSSNLFNTTSIKRASSGSLIDFTAEGESAASPAAREDIFGGSQFAGPQSQPSAATLSSTGWAVFDLVPAAVVATPAAAEAPPAGYPNVFAASANDNQWNASGWLASQPPLAAAHFAVPETDSWAALMGPTSEQPVAPAASQVQPQPGLVQEQTKTSAGPYVATSVDRSRELPQELFASPFPSAGGFGIRQQLPGFAPPTMPSNPLGSVPRFTQPARSRNPFDFPADSAPSVQGGTFLGMESLQGALPGPLSMPGSAAPSFSNQWSFSPQHAQGVNAYAQLPSTFGAQTGLPGHSVGPSLGIYNSGNNIAVPLFGAGQSFMGAGMSDFPAQNSVRPVGGNPFG
ncbi:hypothetical protein R1flu_008678 [Riccia fluitans]|uniref:Arf-GAP domain-containing protein n=1 Tax=Riccia fluitans TaxID=41844 RepID=A0ABD1YCF0_9MARC